MDKGPKYKKIPKELNSNQGLSDPEHFPATLWGLWSGTGQDRPRRGPQGLAGFPVVAQSWALGSGHDAVTARCWS